ncbi:hypothetical protein [Phaffia rhodozyma]|uniref:Uncharacterized protein n=1 Tax=Phaffia rhodozyma TaxID=264483 RepID=A0A0F7STJ4_PHARH|nr:hypothetical protein [Phaffia rhodozyma]
MAAIYTVFTSPYHAPIPDHLPTLVVTPHGQPSHVLYSYLHTDYNKVNYLLTPSPQGDLCVAKLFPPSAALRAASDLGHGGPPSNRAVRCEASRELKWSIENTGVRSPIYKIVNSDETPLYQISKPNPNADFWTMFYFAYAGHQIPPKRAEFGKIQKNPAEKGGGTRITITGKTEEEKKVWQTLGEGNEDCVEWVICCAVLNLLDDEILKAAEKSVPRSAVSPTPAAISPASSSGPSAASSASRPRPPQQMHQPPPRPGQTPPAPSPRLANAQPKQLRDQGPVPSPNAYPSQQQQRAAGSNPDPRYDPRYQQQRGHDPRYDNQSPASSNPRQGYPQQYAQPPQQNRGKF